LSRIGTILCKLALSALFLLPGAVCLPVEQVDREISEAEPNDDLTTAQSVSLADVTSVRVSGSIANADDIDIYELGHLHSGDSITVEVNTSGSGFDAAAAIFHSDAEKQVGILFATNDNDPNETDGLDPFISETIGHTSDHYFMAVARSFGGLLKSGSYDLTVRVERGGTAPQPRPQTVLLDFNGWSGTTGTGETVTVAAFDAASTEPTYAGQNQAIKDVIIATVNENFAGFNVNFLNGDTSSADTGTSFSTVYIGQSTAGEALIGSEGLGFTLEGTDAYNKNPSDNAVVFINSFGATGLEVREPFTAQELGVAIGNVVAHEVGHLLGLYHVFDPASCMNTFDAAPTLLVDQRFKMAPLHFSIFVTTGYMLLQDGRLMLAETVGRIDNVANRTMQAGDEPLAIASADMDNDANIDLVVANHVSEDIRVLWNNGTGAFDRGLEIGYGAGPISFALGEANNDGNLDVFTVSSGIPSLGLFLNDGNKRFSLTDILTTGDLFTAVTSADFDGDGSNDLATANSNLENVSILTNDGSGTFTEQTSIATGDTSLSLVADDFDADGDIDLATCLALSERGSKNVLVLLNHGDATFAEAVGVVAGLTANTLTGADLDGDGDVDLAVANSLPSLYSARYISNVTVLTNDGSGVFTSTGEFFTGADAQSIAAGDFDGDGDVDLAVACYGDLLIPQDTGQVSVLLNKGDGTFAQDVILATGAGPRSITAADLDHDSDLDLAVANEDDSTIEVFLNDGTANFGVQVAADP